MTHLEALDLLAGHPHAGRFRVLCGDDSDPARRDAYRALVIRLAATGMLGEPAATPPPAPRSFVTIAGSGRAAPPVAATMARLAAMKHCPYRSTDRSCGCSGGRCALRGGRPVSHLDCFDCLDQYPEG